MDRLQMSGVMSCASVAFAATSFCAAVDVSREQEAQWRRWLIPLPKQIEIEAAVTLPASDVGLRLRSGAGDVERTGHEELVALFKDKAGAEPKGDAFEILMGVCGDDGKLDRAAIAEAARLRKVANPEQAYVIQPVGERRLVLSALNERGLYYAAQTLRQLLESKFADSRVTIPLARVLDWPDLAERGEWGGSANRDIAWLASHKMNLVETHISLSVGDDGRGHAQADTKMIELGRRRALKVVPVITHLDQLDRQGVYNAFPELKGKGKSARGYLPTITAPCFAQPKMADIITDWMRDIARQKGVTDVCAWLSEHHVHCSCDDCKQHDQYALEARALVRAWETARQEHPELRLRILLTQGSFSTNDKVLAEAPPEVGITYYDGGRTYNSSRDPMIYPLLEDYAATGRWLGCYPQLTASWRIVCPWSGPQFIKYRLTEFVQKKLKCLCGYATPDNRLYDFNITAAAEWSWSSQGRDEREFAAAYATRKGIKDVDGAADWAVMLGPVAWDVYGSRIPFNQFFGQAAAMVTQARKPKLGEGMFRYFPTLEHIDHDVAVCEKALAIAKRLDYPPYLAETKVVRGYVHMVREIYRIAEQLSSKRVSTYDDRVKLQQACGRLNVAALETTQALKQWQHLATGGAGSTRFRDTVSVTEKTALGIADSLARFGVRNPIKPYLRKVIGQWVSDDFEERERITKKWEVTEHLRGPGTFEITLRYTKGWWGARLFRVALASAPADRPDELTELSVDEHEGSAAYIGKANQYTVVLDNHDLKLRYFILADIKGRRSSDKAANRKGCNGEAQMKARLPEDWQSMLTKQLPMTDDAMREALGPKFSGQGLRVGVVQGGHGSKSILARLKAMPGMDAQPLFAPDAEMLAKCQVVVLPQPRIPLDSAKAYGDFVRAGGGLVTTHNAVGYRGHPLLLTDVCAKGIEHVRDQEWIAVAEHPVTKGIQLNTALPHSYFDHIELECGPKGLVLAQAAQSRRPVVICGEPGKGRYIACGLAIGLASDKETPPKGAEKTLLENAIRWCAGAFAE